MCSNVSFNQQNIYVFTKVSTVLVPTVMVPTVVVHTVLVPTGLVTTGMVPSGLVPSGLVSSGLVPSDLARTVLAHTVLAHTVLVVLDIPCLFVCIVVVISIRHDVTRCIWTRLHMDMAMCMQTWVRRRGEEEGWGNGHGEVGEVRSWY